MVNADADEIAMDTAKIWTSRIIGEIMRNLSLKDNTVAGKYLLIIVMIGREMAAKTFVGGVGV